MKGKYWIRNDKFEIKDSGEAKTLDEVIKKHPNSPITWVAPENWGRTPEKRDRYNCENDGR